MLATRRALSAARQGSALQVVGRTERRLQLTMPESEVAAHRIRHRGGGRRCRCGRRCCDGSSRLVPLTTSAKVAVDVAAHRGHREVGVESPWALRGVMSPLTVLNDRSPRPVNCVDAARRRRRSPCWRARTGVQLLETDVAAHAVDADVALRARRPSTSPLTEFADTVQVGGHRRPRGRSVAPVTVASRGCRGSSDTAIVAVRVVRRRARRRRCRATSACTSARCDRSTGCRRA